MPETKILEISSEQQSWMLQELRRCRYGYFLALHILLLHIRGKNPTEIADFLLCARSSVYRAIEDWQSGKLQDQWWSEEPSVPISLETLSSNSLMSRAKEVFNVSRLVIIIEARESIAPKG